MSALISVPQDSPHALQRNWPNFTLRSRDASTALYALQNGHVKTVSSLGLDFLVAGAFLALRFPIRTLKNRSFGLPCSPRRLSLPRILVCHVTL